jgi:hypothetical protein
MITPRIQPPMVYVNNKTVWQYKRLPDLGNIVSFGHG